MQPEEDTIADVLKAKYYFWQIRREKRNLPARQEDFFAWTQIKNPSVMINWAAGKERPGPYSIIILSRMFGSAVWETKEGRLNMSRAQLIYDQIKKKNPDVANLPEAMLWEENIYEKLVSFDRVDLNNKQFRISSLVLMIDALLTYYFLMNPNMPAFMVFLTIGLLLGLYSSLTGAIYMVNYRKWIDPKNAIQFSFWKKSVR